jgi:hypothetical protein
MTTPGQYNVLNWSGSFDGPWSDEAVKRYRENGCDGLSIAAGADIAPPNLGFLHNLGGLKYLSLNVKMKNDIDAFKVQSLEDLTLVTGCRLPVPETVQPNLRTLCLTSRPKIDVAAHWPGLQRFRVGNWRESNLQILMNAGSLAELNLECRRQSGSLVGIENCTSLRSLQTVDYSILETTPLKELRLLADLKLLAARPTGPHEKIDISDLTKSNLAKLWISNARQILNLELLEGIQTLREVRLIGCQLSDPQKSFLNAIAKKLRLDVS